MPLHTELWFPSAIWSGVKPEIDNMSLKSFAYKKRKEDPGVQISNFNGWQSSSIGKNESQSLDYLVSVLDKEIKEICVQTSIPDLQIYNIWLNINPPGGFNTLHDHAGSVFSGVYYVDADEDQGAIVFERGDSAHYFLPKIEKRNYFNSSACGYKSKTSALYIFPSWLKHRVEPNNSTRDRISISFNYGVVNAS
jgi:uncharacterized protein (TIGR02466 family)